MSLFTLLKRSLLFYWRSNLAVISGVIIATAVLGGALIVGDSVRDSLKQMSLDRLGAIDHALTGPRFFRQQLAADLSARLGETNTTVAPALVMQGTLEVSRESGSAARAGHIQVYGVEQTAWEMLQHASIEVPKTGEIVLSQRAADQIRVKPGDQVSLIVEIPASIPRDALLGDREETITELALTVSGIADDTTGLSRLGFNPTQQLPLNAFISLEELQTQTGLAAVGRSRRNPIPKPARVNTLLLATGGMKADAPAELSPERAKKLSEDLQQVTTLDDLALRLVVNEEHAYLSLESEQMFLETSLAEAGLAAANAVGGDVSPVQVYLLNEMWNAANPEKYSMYSVIAGIDLSEKPPFGPFDYLTTAPPGPLSAQDVLINEWLAQDLEVQAGDKVRVKYHVVGDRGELPEEEREFTVAGIVRLSGPAEDQGFTPNVPGVTDADSYAEWREPFPLKRNRITGRDDDYWENYRTTPKMFVSLKTAQDLWRSRYGDLTSIRISPREGESLDDLKEQLETQFLAELTPEATQLVLQPVKYQGLTAAAGTTDFTGLFIGFSFFLIAAAIMLIALLFRLAVELRGNEFGVLSAVGFGQPRSKRFALAEGLLLSLIGGLLGLLAAVGYAALMIHGLRTWWIGAIGTRFLMLSVQPVALAAGFLIAILVALLAVWWAVRRLSAVSTRSLLQGGAAAEDTRGVNNSGHASRWLSMACLGGGGLLLAATLSGLIPQQEAFGGFSWRVVMFFVIGVAMLTGGLSLLSMLLSSGQSSQMIAVQGEGFLSRCRLAFRNASRKKSRSILTTSLIAWATFVLVAVAAGRMNPASLSPDPRSGNGGFTLVAEANVPILYDLNTPAGRAKLNFDPNDEHADHLFSEMQVQPFLVKQGENASCLNLYRTQLPTILGVPEDVLDGMISGNRFLFADTPGEHPWELLKSTPAEGRIPVLGDMNTLMYSLHKGIGATIEVPDTDGPGGTLEVTGMFAGSVFQGLLVMSETNFRKLFPRVAGYSYFLIEVDPSRADEASELLESRLGDFGFDAERVSDRITDFLAVQNTYLSTFQTLGGLGLLLGTAGLAVVMLRNVVERRGELALLRAVGFQPADVGQLVLYENALLLAWGLTCGAISALLAMSPHLRSGGADVPWSSLILTLLGVFVIGLLSALLAVKEAVRTPILSTLRGE